MNKIDNQEKERATVRTYFTKILNSLKSELVKTPIDKSVVLDATLKLGN